VRRFVLRFQRIPIGVLDRLNRQIDIERGPVKVTGRRALESDDRLDRCPFEPWEVLEGKEEFPSV
jgi:hypothetical protein